ncbi:hypothetical protein JBE04_09100 [Streptomyces sp. PRKS01-29]|nr:hypothetical protein [Streptomyces sabulosicollis]MBI0294625.1 hypothetical protein [Streptomyces sabulosicollis]
MLDTAGVPRAAVSASRHATEVPGRTGLVNFFTSVVDGKEAARPRPPGKPDPGNLPGGS